MQNAPTPRSRWWPVMVGLVATAIVGTVVIAMWQIEPLANDDPQARVTAIQTAFTISFGVGGLATLGLFARRQWLQERMHAHERHDARERRITDQYLAAVEQLGHDKAPVRLAGLYALDRIGRDHLDQRQVIAEVWCAYLRRRYLPPVDLIARSASRSNAGQDVGESADTDPGEKNPYDEYEVRMTAQRLLAGHLRDPRPKYERDATPPESREFWRLDRIDLTGATLVDADFSDCWLPEVRAAHARFHGRSNFANTRFDGPARFERARFEDEAEFHEASFGDEAGFDSADFAAAARFVLTHFAGVARFSSARFHDDAKFSSALFAAGALFVETHFEKQAGFIEARFKREAFFLRAHFSGFGWFKQAHFHNFAQFSDAHFERGAEFQEAHFLGLTQFKDIQLVADGNIGLTDAVVHRLDFEREHTWPPGWEPVESGPHWAGEHWVLVRDAATRTAQH